MNYFKGFKSILNLRTLAVALIFAGIVYYYYSRRDWALEVPVAVEKCIDLCALIDAAEPDYGFGGKRYYLRLHSDPHDNEDDKNLFIQAAARSQFHYDGIPVHRDAVLELGFGFHAVQEDIPLKPVRFEVEFTTDHRSTKIISETRMPRGTGIIRQFEYMKVPLQALEGETGRLAFRCEPEHAYKPGDVICCWISPKIDSSGKRQQLKKVAFERTVVSFDLIETGLPAASEEGAERDKPCWALGPKGVPYEMDGPCGIDFSFIPQSDFTMNHSGTRASLAFGRDHRETFPDVPVPDAEGVALQFGIALKEISAAAGGADFIVEIDGEVAFKESVAGGEVSDRWRDRAVDLSRYGDEKIRLTFEVRFHDQTSRKVEIPEFNLLKGGGGERSLEVLHAVAGFGHPRIVYRERQGRRFASRTAPNLIVVNIECLHSAYLGCYGSPLGLTPSMDRLAEMGILFKDFAAASSWTLPSVATLFTGVYPSVHGVVKEDRAFLPNRYLTLAELMQKHGITTSAFVTNELLNPVMNFDQGFEDYMLAPYQNGRKMNALFRNWLASKGDFRFFAYFHYFEPHDPCNAPDGLRDRYVPEAFRGRDGAEHDAAVRRVVDVVRRRSDRDWTGDVDYLRGRYFGEIAYVDRRLEELLRILDERGLLGKTLIVVTGDHGEEYMEHGYLGHGSQLFNESIKVPLIIWGDEALIGPHRVVEGMKDNASLYATLAHLMGLEGDGEIDDLVRPSLLPLSRQKSGQEGFAFSQTAKGLKDPAAEVVELKPLYAMMNWRYKLVHDGEGYAFFDLVEDPGELDNRAGQGLPSEGEIKKTLERILKQIREQRGPQYGAAMDARILEKMRGLGYNF